jgi:hypothetical protein
MLELTSVELPFQRPQAQHARFFLLAEENGAPLPAKTEFTWWFHRATCLRMRLHLRRPHLRNPNHNITVASLRPVNEPLGKALAHKNVHRFANLSD